MMLRTGDLNLSQVGDPVKTTVKWTILQHGIIFKSQVQELHRLYWTQKNLMRELYQSEAVKKVYYRGARVWQAIMDELLAKGMKNAQNAMLSGCSAGGLAFILHCDKFRDLLPASAKVKCFSDAGYFIHAKDVSGADHINDFFSAVVAAHIKNILAPSSAKASGWNDCKLNIKKCSTT